MQALESESETLAYRADSIKRLKARLDGRSVPQKVKSSFWRVISFLGSSVVTQLKMCISVGWVRRLQPRL